MRVDLDRSEAVKSRSYSTVFSARAQRPAFIYLGLGLVATVAYYLVPIGWQNTITDVVGLSAVIAIIVGTRMHKPTTPIAWYAMALGQFLFVVGDVVFTYYEEVLHLASPFPSWADVSYLAAYVPLIFALALIVRNRRPGSYFSIVIDASIITVAATVASWVFLMAPQVSSAGATTKETVVSLAYPLADLLLIGMMASVVFSTDMRALSYRMLSASLLALITADTLYTVGTIGDWYATGSPIDAGWTLSYVFWGAAALHPSMRAVTEENKVVTPMRYTRRRLAVEAAAVTAIPLIRIVQALRNEPPHGTILAVGSAIAGLLVIVRMGGLLSALESAALHDPLTSLPNRRLLLDRISQAFRRAERTKSPVAVLFLDLGGFKTVNDRFGHEAGDQALIEIGKRIVVAVRASDTVARLGGDEFVIVCEGLSRDQAEALGRRVRADVAAPLEIGKDLVELSVDLGIAVELAPEEGDVSGLLDAADRAMYHAKQAAKEKT
jgi:diguanylate cyclase